MPLVMICPSCRSPMQLPDDAAGKQFRCGKCQNVFSVGSAPGKPPVAVEQSRAAQRPAASPGGPATSVPVTSGEVGSFDSLPETSDIPEELAHHPRYRILRVLGQGGMGTVYLAEHKVMERTVALKVINPAVLSHPNALERFRLEVKAASRLSHPNIVTAHDAEQAGTFHFLVMEYVEGTDLAAYLKKKGSMPVHLACYLVRQAALGLQHAHEQGLVHRDIKPANLMVTRNGQVKILDFGLVRLRSDQGAPGMTQLGACMGTLEYMAPEQSRDASKADARADIYSLGCSLYCLLTGEPPFQGMTAPVACLVRDPEPLHRLRPEVPEGLSAVVAKMIHREPGQRYQTAAEVARALEPFARQESPSPPSPLPRRSPRKAERPQPTTPPKPTARTIDQKVEEQRQQPPAPLRPTVVEIDERAEKPGSRREREEIQVGPTEARPGKRWLVWALVVLAVLPLLAILVLGFLPPRGQTKSETDRPGLPNTIGMTMVRIPGGSFQMGSPENEEGRNKENEDQHEVEVSEFYLGAREVTQGQFRAVMGYNPSYFSRNAKGRAGVSYFNKPGGGKDKIPAGDDTEEYPVESVSWDEANEFCQKLTEMEKNRPGGWVYRLPREAEWEYACRGRARAYQTFHFGKSLSALQANFDGNFPYGKADKGPYLQRTNKVGAYEKNAFGLYDMHGNVWEWCADWSGKDYSKTGPRQDPPGPREGSDRVFRGGSWYDNGQFCRSAHRNGCVPTSRSIYLGFRAALVPSVRGLVMK
jgi:LSD1 subclass zinc finger protein